LVGGNEYLMICVGEWYWDKDEFLYFFIFLD